MAAVADAPAERAGTASKMKPRTNPVKSFNVVSNQNLSCRVHPCVIFTILDAYVRRPETEKRAIGTLLGYVAEGNVIQITDAFTVVHQDHEEKGTLMDQDYHRQMVQLRHKVAPKEQVVGWFGTGCEIETTSVVIHNFYLSAQSGFQTSQLLQTPLHMIVDTELNNNKLTIKAYMSKVTGVAETLVQFHEIPLRVETLPSERTGIAMLLRTRELNTQALKEKAGNISSMDAFKNALEQLQELFLKCKEYTDSVIQGKILGDAAVGRELTRVLCAEPFFNVKAFEDLCAGSLQDTLMVVYLSNLTRTQITLAEKINAAYSAASSF